LPGLLGDPDLVGIGGDARNMNLTRSQLDEEEYIDGLKPDGFDGEEICSQDLIFVVGYQVLPADGTIANRSRLNALSIEDVADRCRGNPEAQLDEFAMDFAISPAKVLLGKL